MCAFQYLSNFHLKKITAEKLPLFHFIICQLVKLSNHRVKFVSDMSNIIRIKLKILHIPKDCDNI